MVTKSCQNGLLKFPFLDGLRLAYPPLASPSGEGGRVGAYASEKTGKGASLFIDEITCFQ